MPISTTLYTELRFTISAYVQRREWKRLFEACGTDDDEVARTIGIIMGGYDPAHTWAFLDHVLALSRKTRLESAHSIATICYIIARMGQSNVSKSLRFLRSLLLENYDLRDQVSQGLSNLMVMDPSRTTKTLTNSWLVSSDHNAMLQEVAVRSCEYLAQNDPELVASFLKRASEWASSEEVKKIALQLLKKHYFSMQKPGRRSSGKSKRVRGRKKLLATGNGKKKTKRRSLNRV